MENKIKHAFAVVMVTLLLGACKSPSSENPEVAQDNAAADTTVVAPADTTANEMAGDTARVQ